MSKSTFVLCAVAFLLIAECACDVHIIKPTYRPPPTKPVLIRAKRDAGDEPLWIYKGDDIPRAPATGDHPFLPTIIDDVKLDPNRRYARSVSELTSQEHHDRVVRSFDSRSSKHHGGSHSTSSGSRDTGATHPGYNRRNS